MYVVSVMRCGCGQILYVCVYVVSVMMCGCGQILYVCMCVCLCNEVWVWSDTVCMCVCM